MKFTVVCKQAIVFLLLTVIVSFCASAKQKQIQRESIQLSDSQQKICKSITELYPHITKDCFFIADFNNTLFERVYENHGIGQEFSVGKGFIRPVEKDTFSFLQFLREKGIKTIVATSRTFIKQTEHELENIQDLSIKSFSFAPFHLGSKRKIVFKLHKGNVTYQDGILYCGAHNKGKALQKLFNILKLVPPKIVFIDDKEKHVTAVEKMAQELRIPYVSLRYVYGGKC